MNQASVFLCMMFCVGSRGQTSFREAESREQTGFREAESREQTGFRDVVEMVNNQIFPFLSEKSGDENLIISPLSIGLAASMLYHGAAGSSKKQLRNALSLYEADLLRADVSDVLDRITNLQSNVTLRLANGIFLNNGFRAKPRYTKLIETDYSAEIQTLPNNVNKVDIVNTWISNKTEGIINKFLSEGSINDDTKMLILNAVYFYGAWLHPFEKSLTSLQRFFLAGEPRRYVVTEFMDLEESLELVDVPEKMKVIFLPYEDQDYSMVLYLPHENIQIDDFVSEVFGGEVDVNELRNMSKKSKVNLQLPRFDLSTKNSLVEALEYYNVTDIFEDSSADLSRISDEPISVGDILHSASVKVDEEGSTGAAVSSVSIDIRTSVSGPIELIRFNRPFLFSIINEEGTQLFSGKVMKPTKKRSILDTEEPTITDIPDDTILAVLSPETLLERASDTSLPTVAIKCPMGKDETQVVKFNSCEKGCEDGHKYGMCILGCWNRFC